MFKRWGVTSCASIAFSIPIISVFLFNMRVGGDSVYFFMDIGYLMLGFATFFFYTLIFSSVLRIFFKKLDIKKSTLYSMPIVVSTLLYGYFNATDIRVNRIRIPSSIGMKIAFISDMHIGGIHSQKLLNQLDHFLKGEEVDMLIIGGDTIMPGFERYKSELIRVMQAIRPKYGVIAVLGNHEGYCGVEKSIKILKEAGICVLYDSHRCIDNKICVLGRADEGDPGRKQIDEIVPKTDLPVIVVDHRPSDFSKSSNANAFMQLSGHTHAGQLFPNNFLQKKDYEPRRLRKIKDMYFYITSGFGVSGAPYRIGTTPEIVVFSFDENIKQTVDKN